MTRTETKCPACGAGLVVKPESIRCEHYSRDDGCDFSLWSNSLKTFHAALTPEQMSALVSGETIRLVGLVGKSGKVFSCDGKLEKWVSEDGSKSRWSVKMIFGDSRPPTSGAGAEAGKADKKSQEPEPETVADMEDVF